MIIKHSHINTIKKYTIAAESGDSKALSYLGAIYRTGTDVKQNIVKAAEWFTEAANQ